MLTTKKLFPIDEFVTVSGKKIKDFNIGYETYGELNLAKDNAILVCHYFSGNSHCAMKYNDNDPSPGYWDDLIGPEKYVNTNKYFVLSSDTLVNLSCKDPNVATVGPCSINGDTGKPYGLTFPIVTIQDFVRVQKLLVDSFGITKLAAVMGPSMGSMQAVEWAASYPNMVQRVVAVISSGLECAPYCLAMLQSWSTPITFDPNWCNGDYYANSTLPTTGLVESLYNITVATRAPEWSITTGGREPADPQLNPFLDWSNEFLHIRTIKQGCATRVHFLDANHLLYLVRASQSFQIGGGLVSVDEAIQKIQSKLLFIPVSSDLLLLPEYSERAVELLKRHGKRAELFTISTNGGHIDGLLRIAVAGPKIKEFLESS